MKMRALFGGSTALALAVAAVAALPALSASAAPAATAVTARPMTTGSGRGQNLSSTVAFSWQTNSTVWAIAAAAGAVYVGGQFTAVRPPGDAAGKGNVTRTYLAKFNAKTGKLLTFHPTLDGDVRALAVSPNGKTLYVGGAFTHVTMPGAKKAFRERLAAFSTVTGALSTTWQPTANSKVLAIDASGSSVYLGGDFTSLDSQPRSHAGAVSTGGGLLPWAPQPNGSVTSVAAADSRVLVGGYFTQIDGVTQQAIGSTDPKFGAHEPWAATIVPNRAGCTSVVKDIVVQGATAYIANEGSGGGCFDGTWAARVSNGALVWENECLGATQALAIVNNWLYKGSHAHDCAYTAGGWPQVPNPAGGNVTHRLLDQSLANGTLGHWTPTTNGNNLGPRVMATDGTRLFVGGEFTTVNGRPQQGFARFAPTPDATTPGRPARPTVTSTSAGVESVTFAAVSDRDDGTLTYTIYRRGRTRPIARLTATSWPWALPVLHFRDTGLRHGSRHAYRVSASDGTSTSARSPWSTSVKVASKSPSVSYSRAVLNSKPSFFWPLSQKTGTTATDATTHHLNGIYEPGTSRGVAGPITGSKITATGFNGRSGLVTSASQVPHAPQAFSIEGWFKTTTDRGGKLIGFGSSQTGMSSAFDRQIYMMNDGQLVFGVRNGSGQIKVIESSHVYNNGKWHYVVATLSTTAGMTLRIDGGLAGKNSTTSTEDYSGFWRVGGDNLAGGWNLDPWGSNSQGTTQPNSYYFSGDICDVAVYPVALTASQVAAHYAANARSH